MSAAVDTPATRADRLLWDVLGEARYRQLRSAGYLDLPSGRHPGRVYRLDNLGNLSFREPGESSFNTSLCVQPEEAVPRDDQIAMRYLLVTADEERLVKVANPITFGFMSLARALYHDLGQNRSRGLALMLTVSALAFFLAALVGEVFVVAKLVGHQPGWGIALLVALLLPSLVGVLLLAAAGVEAARALHAWSARRRLLRQMRKPLCVPESGSGRRRL